MRTKLLVAAVAVALAAPVTAASVQMAKEDNVVKPQHWDEQVSVSNVVDASAAYAEVVALSEGSVLTFNFVAGYGIPKYIAHLAEDGQIRKIEVDGESGEVIADEVHNPFPGEAPTISEKDALTKASEVVSGEAESIAYEFHGGADEGAYRVVMNDKENDKLNTLVISSTSGNVLMQSTDNYGFGWGLWKNKPQAEKAPKNPRTIKGAQKLLNDEAQTAKAQAAESKNGFWDDFWWNLPVEEPTWISVNEAIDQAQLQVSGLTLSADIDLDWQHHEDDDLFAENYKVRIFDTDYIATVMLNAADGSLIEIKEGPIKQVAALDDSRTSGEAIQLMLATANEKSNDAQIMDLSIYRDDDNENNLTYVVISQDTENLHVSRFDAATGEFLTYNSYEL